VTIPIYFMFTVLAIFRDYLRGIISEGRLCTFLIAHTICMAISLMVLAQEFRKKSKNTRKGL